MISRSRRKHRITAPNRLAIPAAIKLSLRKRAAALFLGIALATSGSLALAQDEAPGELPSNLKAKPVTRKRVSDSAEAANQLSFGAIKKSKIPSEPKKTAVRTAEGSTAKGNRVVRALASGESQRGDVQRVAATEDGDIAPVQWTASRQKSVLVNGPQDPDQDKDLPKAPAAPKTNSPAPATQPPGKLRADCGNEMQACEDARAKVYANTIDRIQIDLSPLLFSEEEFKSLDAMIEASEQLTREGLKDSPYRSWTDRNGGVIAQNSRLLRVRANSIVVVDANGGQQTIPLAQLSEGEMCEISDTWGIPVRCEMKEELYAGRAFCPSTFTWTASALCHKPLYFEQIELERYGHTPGPILEAPMAGAKFAADLMTLPYKMGINPPNECQYALGFYRPGNCAPWIVPPVPLSLRGAIFQATAVTGVSWLIP